MYYGGVMCNTNWNRDEIILGLGSFNLKASAPDGYGIIGYEKAIRDGNISAKENISVSSTASGAMGVNAEATTDISVIFANADAQLIVSGFGDATLSLSADGSVVASLSGQGNATFTVNMNHLAMYVDAYGFASANLDIVTNSNGTMSAIAACSGSTVDTAGLTPASIWTYQNRTLTAIDVEVSGLTAEQAEQLSKTATKGDVWAARFA